MSDFNKNLCAFQTVYKKDGLWMFDYAYVETHGECLWNERSDQKIAAIAASDMKKFYPKDIAFVLIYFGYEGGRKSSDVRRFFEAQVSVLHCGYGDTIQHYALYIPNKKLHNQFEKEVALHV